MNPTLLSLAILTLLASRSLAAEGDPIRWQPLREPGGGGRIVSVTVSPHNIRHLVAGGDMLGSAVSTDGGETWQPGLGLPSYEMGSATFHPHRPQTVWIGSCSGPCVSEDGGRTWRLHRQGMPPISQSRYTCIIEKVLIDPDHPSRLLAFGGSSRRWNSCDTFGWIWRSDDDGETWRHIGTIGTDGFSSKAEKGANIVRAFYGPSPKPHLHLLADDAGWWSSRDGGEHWTKNAPTGITGPILGVTIHPVNPAIVWIVTGCLSPKDGTPSPGGIFKSMDGGKSFFPADSGIRKITSGNENQLSSFADIVVSAAAPDVLYTCDFSWSSSTIYKSEDGGAKWRPCAARRNPQDGQSAVAQIETACFAGPSVQLSIAPQSADVVYGFNSEYILRTTDAGLSWTDVTALRPDPAQPDHWRGRGWNGWCCTDIVFNPFRKGQSLLLAMDAGRGWLSDDGLQTWRYTTAQTHPWLGGQCAAFSRDGFIYITTGQFGSGNGIQCSRDGGKNWITLEGAARGLPPAGWNSGAEYGDIYVHPEQGRKAWAAVGGRLVATVDGGERWTTVAGIVDVHRLAGDPRRPGRFFATCGQGVFVTDDGQTFTDLGLSGCDTRGRIQCDAKGRALVCRWRTAQGPGLWRYDPAAGKWTRLLDEPLAFECSADPSDPTRLLLVTSQDPYFDTARGNGVWISSDDGAGWTQANADLPMYRINACAFDPFDPEQMVIGMYGGGFATARWPQTYRPVGSRRYRPTAEDETSAKPLPAQRMTVQVKNGNMTEGNDTVAGWQNAKRDTTVFKAAPAALRIDGAGMAVQKLEGVSGRAIIRIKGWMKTEGSARAQVAVQGYAQGFAQNVWKQLIYAQGDTDWTLFDKEIELPAWTWFCELKFLVEGDGRAWLDEIE